MAVELATSEERMRNIIPALIFVVVSAPALSQTLTVAQLLTACQGPWTKEAESFCITYLRGFSDGIDAGRVSGTSVCVPRDASMRRAWDFVLLSLKLASMRGEDEAPARAAVSVGLRDAFPCR